MSNATSRGQNQPHETVSPHGGKSYRFRNSVITVEAGRVLKVERAVPEYAKEYVGPVSEKTLDVIEEVGRVV